MARELTADLRSELARLQSSSPFEALGLSANASGDAVRAAFLAAAKRFHPSRFARQPPDVVELATEIFVAVRKAYANLAEEGKRRAWRERLSPAAPVSPRPPAAPRTAGGTGSVASVDSAPPVAGRTPPTEPPGRRRSPTAPGGVPILGTGTDVQAMLESVRTRPSRLEQANQLIATGRYLEAREALLALATEDPQNRKLRLRLHLAWGLEHREARRLDEAVRELERAFALDPSASDVNEALRVTREQRDAARAAGLLPKIFGR